MASTYEVPKKMKALIKEDAVPSYILKEIDVPEPTGDEVLIKVESNSICGSDIALYHYNDIAKAIATLPFIPGHETSGVVVKCGEKSSVPVGSRVAVENHYFCGECYQCTHDQRAICQNMGQYGHGKKTIHGGCSQYSIVPSKYCYVLNSDISKDEAALLEPLGVAHNAVEDLDCRNEDVLVVGCGPIGCLVTACAKTMGAVRVIAADIDAKRLSLAKQMGADILIDTSKESLTERVLHETSGNGIGRLVECTGAEPVVNNMWTAVRKGGLVVMVGLPKSPIHIENPLPNFIFKSITVKTIHGRKVFHTWERIEELVKNKKVDVNKVISHRFPLASYEEAFFALFSGEACKIVIYPNSE